MAGCSSPSTQPASISGGSAPDSPTRALPPNSQIIVHGSPLKPAHDAFATLLARSQDLGPLPSGKPVGFLLLLRDPTAARRARDLAAMYNPHSRSFGHFLTPQQVAARYGPSLTHIARVQAWLKQHRISSRWRRGDSWMSVSGPVRLVERVFSVHIHAYLSDNRIRFYASLRDPIVPVALRPDVTAAARISSYPQIRKYAVPTGGLSPAGLLKAYDITPLRNLGLDGAGQTVAFLELDGFRLSDFDAFTKGYHLPLIRPIIKAGPKVSDVAGETEMDLEVVHAIAPKARLVLYNVEWKKLISSATTFADVGNKLSPLQTTMVNGNPGGVISQSWGECDALLGRQVAQAWKSIYDRADLLGESVFVSSGDSGGYECLSGQKPDATPGPDTIGIPLPAGVPGVTSVGGTRLSVRVNGDWYKEEVWEEPALTAGGGGGLSAYLSMPSWETGPGVSTPATNPHRMLEVPDVSADADPSTGAAINMNGSWTQGGGTSQAAPLWAGITVLINQYLASQHVHHAGFLNPALFALAAGSPAHPPLHDVTLGTNLVYPAGPGYDMATGLGTPDAWNLARDLASYLKGSTP